MVQANRGPVATEDLNVTAQDVLPPPADIKRSLRHRPAPRSSSLQPGAESKTS